MKTTEDLTDGQLIARDIFCLLTGVTLILLGAWACVWLIWGIITLHVVGTVEGLMVLPCWLLGLTLIDIATGSATDQDRLQPRPVRENLWDHRRQTESV